MKNKYFVPAPRFTGYWQEWGIFMIRKPNFILVDNCGKEVQEKDAHLLDLSVNDGDIHQFAAGHIPRTGIKIWRLLFYCREQSKSA